LICITVSITVQTVANGWKENFAAKADEVTAQVTGTNSYPGDLHTITVRYQRGERDYETTHNVVDSSAYEIGDPVEVLVDPGDPAVAHLETPGDFLPLLVSHFYVLPAVVGGFLIVWLIWVVLRDRRRRGRSGSGPHLSTGLSTTQTDLKPRSTNGFAVASLVLGILWVFWIGSILALVFGYKARRQIHQSGGTQPGRRLATAGIILGYIWLAWFMWLFVTA
jgi:hypothetical protein